jgi:hypothetical protein
MFKNFKSFVKFMVQNLEALIWITTIIYFALSPLPSGEHFTICPLSLAGFEHCPGCGLGRAMILLLHGHVSESINMHPLAIPALALFSARIVIVFKNYCKYQKQITAKTTLT